MAETITLAYFFSVWGVSIAVGWLLRTYAHAAEHQCQVVATAGMLTAGLGGFALWLVFTITGVSAAGP